MYGSRLNIGNCQQMLILWFFSIVLQNIAVGVRGNAFPILPPGELDNTRQVKNRTSESTLLHWSTGPWGECQAQAHNGCGRGERKRSVWCMDSAGYEVPSTNCKPENMPITEMVCFVWCREHKEYLRWNISDWSECTTNTLHRSFKHCSEQHHGVMRRNATCIFTHNSSSFSVVEDHACNKFYEKPVIEKLCSLDCPKNCIVTEYGNWSECNCVTRSKVRTRSVLVAPEFRGESCPVLSDQEPCDFSDCQTLPPKQRQKLIHVSQWSHCQTYHRSHNLPSLVWPYLIGIRTRTISCLDSSGNISPHNYCVQGKSVHSTVEACIIASDCVVSPWSSWKLETKGCSSNDQIIPTIKVRTRYILQAPSGDGKPCPPLKERRNFVKNLTSCEQYQWITSEWSECLVNQLLSSSSSHKSHYGGGIQRRNVICVKATTEVPVDDTFCTTKKPPVVQQCSIPQPVDCVVTSWSAWSPCMTDDLSNMLDGLEDGYQKRYRDIIIHPLGDGKECPPLEEVKQCSFRNLFTWQAIGKTDCALLNESAVCGHGKTKYNWSCIRFDQKHVPSFPCDFFSVPPEEDMSCYIPCAKDCVLSDWSEWSGCTYSSSSSKAYPKRVRKRKILAHAQLGGLPCHTGKKHKFEETESCGDDDDDDDYSGFSWKVSPWKNCILPKNATCGSGFQERDVGCVQNKRIVGAKRCEYLEKPPTQQPCTIDCPIDCITTRFSDWSPCHHRSINKTTSPVQFRRRYVLQYPKHGGLDCPPLEEMRFCNPSGTDDKDIWNTSYNVHWVYGPWSECILPDEEPCGRGFQARTSTCLNLEKEVVNKSLCLKMQVNPIPHDVRPCYKFCNSSCVVSEWTPWTSCIEKCKQKSTRSREIIQNPANGKCDLHLSEERLCPEPVPVYESLSVKQEWSSCILFPSDEKNSHHENCGFGYKYKHGSSINATTCQETGIISEECTLECPVDCKLSPWTSWSACNASCNRKGHQVRERRVLTRNNYAGHPCPTNESTEFQIKFCEITCMEVYKWDVGPWNQCELNEGTEQRCGKGIQTRDIRCIYHGSGQFKKEVNDSFCDHLDKPELTSECYMPCSGECVVSDWSQWSPCFMACDSSKNHTRTRKIMRQPTNSTFHCPPLLEERPCPIDKNCFELKYIFSDWSSCILPENSTCGPGTHERILRCVHTNGTEVNEAMCHKISLPPLPANLTENCYIDCPIDCVMTQWSEWNDSQCQPCAREKTVMTRSRKVHVEPSITGRPCPSELEQWKPCPFKHCYSWHISPWSPCYLQEGLCGYGVRKRTITCNREDGFEVDKDFCLKINKRYEPFDDFVDRNWLMMAQDLKEEETCYIPCSDQCQIADWSPWSSCYTGSCNIHVGYQTRSRAAISNHPEGEKLGCHDMWQIKPCISHECMKFQWTIIEGKVMCTDTLGNLVTGGCKPLDCFPPCPATHALCNHTTGACQCEEGYAPVSTLVQEDVGNGRWSERTKPALLRCEMLQAMDSGHTGNHTSSDEEIFLKYYPDDNEASFWMYAMITVGSAFVVFVAVTIYLMCRSHFKGRFSLLRRRGQVRRRPQSPEEGDFSTEKTTQSE